MTTIQKMEYRVSTYINVKGDFTGFSDNLKVINDTIIINNTNFIVELIETDLMQENLEIFVSIPVIASAEEEAEVIAQGIIDKAENVSIYLLDLDNGAGWTLNVKGSDFAKAEYHIY